MDKEKAVELYNKFRDNRRLTALFAGLLLVLGLVIGFRYGAYIGSRTAAPAAEDNGLQLIRCDRCGKCAGAVLFQRGSAGGGCDYRRRRRY